MEETRHFGVEEENHLKNLVVVAWCQVASPLGVVAWLGVLAWKVGVAWLEAVALLVDLLALELA